MSKPILQAVDISKQFTHWPGFFGFFTPKTVTALQGLSLEFSRGEVVGITGDNGAGKTTLLKVLAGLLVPSAGRVLLDGNDIGGLGSGVRSRVAIAIAESRSFYWRLTCRQNLEFFSSLHGLDGQLRERRIGAAVEKMGLQDRMDDKFFTLSSGLMQRMALARAMLGDADAWLLDEPTRDVDDHYSAALFEEVNRLKEAGRCVVLVGHDRRELDAAADRIIVMEHGRVSAEEVA